MRADRGAAGRRRRRAVQEMIDFLARLEKELGLGPPRTSARSSRRRTRWAPSSNNVGSRASRGLGRQADGAAESLDQRGKELGSPRLTSASARRSRRDRVVLHATRARRERREGEFARDDRGTRSCRSRPPTCSSSTSTRPTRRRCRRASTSRPTRAARRAAAEGRAARPRGAAAPAARQPTLKDKQAADTARMMEQMKKLLAEMLPKQARQEVARRAPRCVPALRDQVPEVNVCDRDGPRRLPKPASRSRPTRSSTRSSRTCTAGFPHAGEPAGHDAGRSTRPRARRPPAPAQQLPPGWRVTALRRRARGRPRALAGVAASRRQLPRRPAARASVAAKAGRARRSWQGLRTKADGWPPQARTSQSMAPAARGAGGCQGPLLPRPRPLGRAVASSLPFTARIIVTLTAAYDARAMYGPPPFASQATVLAYLRRAFCEFWINLTSCANKPCGSLINDAFAVNAMTTRAMRPRLARSSSSLTGRLGDLAALSAERSERRSSPRRRHLRRDARRAAGRAALQDGRHGERAPRVRLAPRDPRPAVHRARGRRRRGLRPALYLRVDCEIAAEKHGSATARARSRARAHAAAARERARAGRTARPGWDAPRANLLGARTGACMSAVPAPRACRATARSDRAAGNLS